MVRTAVLLVAVAGLHPVRAEQPNQDFNKQEVQLWAEKLSSASYAEREQASNELLASGEVILPMLDAIAARSNDLEAVARSERIKQFLENRGAIEQAWDTVMKEHESYDAIESACKILMEAAEQDPEARAFLEGKGKKLDANGKPHKILQMLSSHWVSLDHLYLNRYENPRQQRLRYGILFPIQNYRNHDPLRYLENYRRNTLQRIKYVIEPPKRE